MPQQAAQGPEAATPADSAAVVDKPDARIDELWAQEAESRIAAFEGGQIQAVPAEDVLAELQQP